MDKYCNQEQDNCLQSDTIGKCGASCLVNGRKRAILSCEKLVTIQMNMVKAFQLSLRLRMFMRLAWSGARSLSSLFRDETQGSGSCWGGGGICMRHDHVHLLVEEVLMQG